MIGYILAGLFDGAERAMTQNSDAGIFEAVGMAVIASQAFEKIFVLAARFAIDQSAVTTLEDVMPVDGAKAFKQPITAILRELSGSIELVDYEERIKALTQSRHEVVHRISQSWPAASSDAERIRIRELCINVTAESLDLLRVFTLMMGEWTKRFPTMKPHIEALNLDNMFRHGVQSPA